MPEHGFSLTHIFLYKDRIDSALIRENMGQRKPVFWYVFHSTDFWEHGENFRNRCYREHLLTDTSDSEIVAKFIL